jgi:predicted ester cyclase
MSVTKNVPSSLEELIQRYNGAWNDHDLEEILALQTPDSSFLIHGAQDVMKWEGIDACRECYTYLLQAFPDQKFETTSTVISKDMYVCHHYLTGTLTLPWQMGGRTYQPSDKPIRFELVDIMTCENNLVKVKNGWIDGLAIHKQLTAD